MLIASIRHICTSNKPSGNMVYFVCLRFVTDWNIGSLEIVIFPIRISAIPQNVINRRWQSVVWKSNLMLIASVLEIFFVVYLYIHGNYLLFLCLIKVKHLHNTRMLHNCIIQNIFTNITLVSYFSILGVKYKSDALSTELIGRTSHIFKV